MIKKEQLTRGIEALEEQRGTLGDAVVDALIAAARDKLDSLARQNLQKRPANAKLKATRAAPRALYTPEYPYNGKKLPPLLPPPNTRKAPPGKRTKPKPLRGERKQITVIVADIQNSTPLLEQLGTEAWVALMNHVFQILETEIYRFGGEVDQFRGDGLVALFGATTAHEDDPQRAIMAGLAMQAAHKSYADELAESSNITLQLRIGINTGEAIITNIGNDKQHNEDTAMGVALAVAARMESSAQPGSVLVSENTYQLSTNSFSWQPLGKLQVKGVRLPLKVYRPLNALSTQGKIRSIAGLISPLVGRHNELNTLRAAITRLRAGIGGMITVAGEAGLGKSRLIAELSDLERHDAANLRWIEGRCSPYGMSSAYQLWLGVLRGLLHIEPQTKPQAVSAALQKHINQLCHPPEKGSACTRHIYTYLAQLLALAQEEQTETLRKLSSAQHKRNTFKAISDFVEAQARDIPLVVICEDLHWIDPTSLDLLSEMLALTERVPLLLICVVRPETARGGQVIKRVTKHSPEKKHPRLWIVALSNTQSKTLLNNLLQAEKLPANLKDRILNHAEGNPFYVEELLHSLMNDQTIIKDHATGTWEVTKKVTEITIPATLYGVLMSRIDHLPADAKRVLQLAAVIGRVFPYRVLKAIDKKQRELDKLLLILQQKDLIHVRAEVKELEYIFKHHMTQESAYNSLLLQDRRTIHHRVAKALEDLYPEHIEKLVGILAHHWTQAEIPEKATPYLLQAGKQATSRAANAEATTYFSQALSLTPKQAAARYDMLLTREKLYDLQGNRREQAQDLKELTQLANALDSPTHQREVALRQARYAESCADAPALIHAAKRVIALAKITRDANSEAAGYMYWGRALFEQGEPKKAYVQLKKALSRADGSPQVEADTRCSLGQVCTDPTTAQAYFKQALHIQRKIGNRRGEWEALYHMSSLTLEQGNSAKAQAYCRHALRICGEIGDRQGEGATHDALGYIALYHGDYPGAKKHYRRALQIHREIGNAQGEVNELLYLSLRAHQLGENQKAHQYAQQARQHVKNLADQTLAGNSLTFLGHALAGLGCFDEAENTYQQALKIHQDSNERAAALEPLAGLAYTHLKQGRLRQARRFVDEILEQHNNGDLEGADNVFQIYMTCIQVLQANKDRRANSMLRSAYQLLQTRARKISNAALQLAFLENIAIHRGIQHEWNKLQKQPRTQFEKILP